MDYRGPSHEELRNAVAPLIAETSELRDELNRAIRRINQLELFVEAILTLGEAKKLFSADEWQVMAARVDLMDGIEDGKRNPLEYRGAPVCHHCQRYANPQRGVCVYCGNALVDPNARTHAGPYRGGAPMPAEPKRVSCAQCNLVVRQTDTYFNSAGALVCADCFQT